MEIIKNYNFKNIDDIILGLNQLLAHEEQESLEINFDEIKNRRRNGISVLDDIYQILPDRLVTICVDFAELTKNLGEELGYEVKLIDSHPIYLNNHPHWLVSVNEVFKDPSIYKAYFINGKLVESEPEFMLYVPEEQLGKYRIVESGSFWKKKSF